MNSEFWNFLKKSIFWKLTSGYMILNFTNLGHKKLRKSSKITCPCGTRLLPLALSEIFENWMNYRSWGRFGSAKSPVIYNDSCVTKFAGSDNPNMNHCFFIEDFLGWIPQVFAKILKAEWWGGLDQPNHRWYVVIHESRNRDLMTQTLVIDFSPRISQVDCTHPCPTVGQDLILLLWHPIQPHPPRAISTVQFARGFVPHVATDWLPINIILPSERLNHSLPRFCTWSFNLAVLSPKGFLIRTLGAT